MRHLLRVLAFALSYVFILQVPAYGQTLTVSGTKIEDSTGTVCASCTITFAPASNSGAPISFRMGGGGQVISLPIQATVSNGAFSVALPDTAHTSPANVCFVTTVTENVTGQVVLSAGYNCVQPSSAASWCTGTACDFDNYDPNLAPLVIVQNGPQGPQGTPGCTLGSGCSGVAQTSPTSNQTITQPSGTALNVLGVKPVTGLLGPQGAFLVCSGDSRMAGTNVGPGEDICTYISQQPQFSNITGFANGAVGGDTCSNQTSRYPYDVYPYRPSAIGSSVTYLITNLGMINSIFQGVSESTLKTCMLAYLNQAKADGFTVIGMTEFYSTANSDANDTVMENLNNWLVNESGYLTFDTRAFIAPATASLLYGILTPMYTVTSYAISGGVLTAQSTNSLSAGQTVEFTGLTAGNPNIQGVTGTVLSSGLSGSQFEISTSLPNTASTATNGGFTAVYAPITSYSIASGVLSAITATNVLTAGETVYLSGFTGSNSYLNGTVASVNSSGLSSTTFQATVPYPDIGSTSATGKAEGYALAEGTHLMPTIYKLLASAFNAWWGIAESGTNTTVAETTQSYFNPQNGVTHFVNDVWAVASGVPIPGTRFLGSMGSASSTTSGEFDLGSDGCGAPTFTCTAMLKRNGNNVTLYVPSGGTASSTAPFSAPSYTTSNPLLWVTAQTPAGTGATGACLSGAVCDFSGGWLTLTTGTSPTTGLQFVAYFTTALAHYPRCVFQDAASNPINLYTAGLFYQYSANSAFGIGFSGTVPTGTYTVLYHCD